MLKFMIPGQFYKTIILYLYLIFNSLISNDITEGFYRNFGFLRFILFLNGKLSFFYFRKSSNTFKIWTIIFFIVLIDIYIERFTGSNIFGFGKIEIDGVPQPHGARVVSFFRTEPIAGAFICGFTFIIVGYILNFLKSKNKLKSLGFIIILFCLVGIMLTGERSNGFKALIGFSIFILVIDYVKLKNKILVSIIFFSIFFFTVNFSDYVKGRYIYSFYNKIKTKDEREEFLNNSLYIKFISLEYMFLKIILGLVLAIKTIEYRHVIPKKIQSIKNIKLTHPHQVYIEMLSEHGIIGTIIIISIIFYLAFRIIRKIIDSRNYIQAGCLIFLLINFTPILPSGWLFLTILILLYL